MNFFISAVISILVNDNLTKEFKPLKDLKTRKLVKIIFISNGGRKTNRDSKANVFQVTSQTN